VGLEPTSGTEAATCFRDRLLIRPDDFPAVGGSFFAELPQRLCQRRCGQPPTNCGGWNRTSGLLIQSQASLPAATAPQFFHHGCVSFAKGSGRRIRTFIACFKGRWPTISRSPNVVSYKIMLKKCPAGVGPACPVWKTGAFAARPRARCVSFRAAVAGIEPATKRLTAAHPYQHEHHRNCIPLSLQWRKVGVAGFEPTISCFRSTRISKLSHTPITGRRRPPSPKEPHRH
jgi:hypothetical protein